MDATSWTRILFCCLAAVVATVEGNPVSGGEGLLKRSMTWAYTQPIAMAVHVVQH